MTVMVDSLFSPVALSPAPGALPCARFPREDTAAACARRLARSTLSGWGMGEVSDDVVLAVSELVSNAVRHTYSSFVEVELAREPGGGARLSVRDQSVHDVPCAGLPRAECESGRGLMIVDSVASSWGSVVQWPVGKTVWAVFRP